MVVVVWNYPGLFGVGETVGTSVPVESKSGRPQASPMKLEGPDGG